MNTLLYAMGGASEDISTSFTFAAGADQNDYDDVKEKFDPFFNDIIIIMYLLITHLKILMRLQKILYTYCNCQRHQNYVVTSLEHHVIHDK